MSILDLHPVFRRVALVLVIGSILTSLIFLTMAFAQQPLPQKRQKDAATKVSKLLGIGVQAKENRNYEAAEKTFQTALELSRVHKDFFGEGNTLNRLGDLFFKQEKYRQAVDYYMQASKVWQRHKVLNGVAMSLESAATAYFEQGQHQLALDNFEKALALWKQLGNAENVANDLNNIGLAYHKMEKYQEAINSYQKVLNIQGIDLPGKGSALNGLGNAHYYLGDYLKALAFQEEALKLAEKTGNQRGIGFIYVSIGLIYQTQGKQRSALDSYRQAYSRMKKLGKTEEIATCLNGLGNTYLALGQYSAAEKMFQQAMKLGINNNSLLIALAESYTGLASLHRALEQNLTASAENHKALEIRLKLGRPALIIDSLVNLATDYYVLRRFEDAINTFHHIFTTYENALIPRDKARCYLGLGIAYLAQKHYAKAMQSFQELYEISVQMGTQDMIAASFNNIGATHYYREQYQEALYNFQQAYKHQEESKNPKTLAATLRNISSMQAALGQFPQATASLWKSLDFEQRFIEQVSLFTSEKELSDFLHTLHEGQDNLLTLASDSKSATSSDCQQAFLWTLRRKGVVFNTQLRLRRIQHALTANTQLRQIETLRRQKLSEADRIDLPHIKRKKIFTDAEFLEKRRNRLLSELYHTRNSEPSFSLANIRAQLSPDSALVEFVRYTPVNFLATGEQNLPPRYLAFVLRADLETPLVVDLGQAAVIDRAVRDARLPIQEFLEAMNIGNATVAKQQSSEQTYRKQAATLYNLVFAPLKTALGTTKVLLLAPDSQLCRFPFEALPLPEGSYLLNTYHISYLTSGRDLLLPTTGKPGTHRAFIAPDFAMPLAEKRLNKLPTPPTTPAKTMVLGGQANFPALIGMQKHIEHIGQLLNMQPLTGKAATEAAFLNVNAPRILYVLTHGFYEPSEEETKQEIPNAEELKVNRQKGNLGGNLKALRSLPDPMQRSGIVLAGANYWQEAQQKQHSIDGLVTARKMGLMNLQGTQLVILAACETGLGQITSGEGTFGIRRALLMAGARSLLVSLFEVPQEATAELTEHFLGEVSSGKGRGEALRTAQLALLKAKRHPVYWAGFVLIGDTGKLLLTERK